MRVELALAAVAASLALHGCGSSGENSTSTTSNGPTGPTTTTTTTPAGPTTTTLNPDPRPPMDGKDVAELMNVEYNGYRQNDSSSPFGNWFRMIKDPNLFYCGGDCYEGKPDCKVSGSVLNWKQMLDDNGYVSGWFGYQSTGLTGFYVNSSLVSTTLAKCAYAWDGSSDNKVNMGCGCPQGTNGPKACNQSDSAYNNKVPPNFTETTTGNSSNVAPCYCINKDKKDWPTDGNGASCFWKGPAFDTSSDANPNEIHEMLDWRVDHQAQGGTGYGPAKTIWNEVNLDGRLLQKALAEDPAGTVLAIVYSTEHGPDALDIAKKLVSAFTKEHNLKAPLPLIRLNTTLDVRSGQAAPWVFVPEDQLDMSLVV